MTGSAERNAEKIRMTSFSGGLVSGGLVHVIDDDSALRDSIEFLLGSAGFSVRLFESAQMFLHILPEITGGCIVADVRMPGIDGIELLSRLQEGGCRLPVIIMTGHGDVPLAVKAMKLGAADFLEKPFEEEALIAAVGAALAGAMEVSPRDEIAAELSAKLASLSERERQVLHGLVAGQTNKEIARDFDLSPRTVEVYRAKLMTKLQASSISELIRFAMRVGETNI
jgi:two-component system response regulator FixJ